MSFYRLAPLILSCALACGACAGAEDADGNDRAAEAPAVDDGLADLTSYVLTLDRVDRFSAASLNIQRALREMTPAERTAFEGGTREQVPSLDVMVDRISANSAVESAVRDAGLSPREYASIIHSMIQAGMAESKLARQPEADPDSMALASGISPATLGFVRDNAEELGRRRQQLDARIAALDGAE